VVGRRTCDREIVSSVPGGALPGSLGQLSLPSWVGKSSTGWLTGITGVKAGCVHLCRVADNTVIPYGR